MKRSSVRFSASLLAAIALMWTTCAAASPDAMTPEEARHLAERTGFGASPADIAAFSGLSYEDGITRIIAELRTSPVTAMPDWTQGWAYPSNLIWTLDQTASELYFTNRWAEIHDLGAWWLAEMSTTPSPLTERLVLFWSDHFANSFDQHENSKWMADQNAFLRSHAAGNFADLAQGMLLDPAMLSYLSNTSNVADAPNENLGREFLELFTLGEGRGYTQADVRAASRMLTGYTISEDGTPLSIFNPDTHDSGNKTIFGQTGPYDADDLVALTLSHPDFGPYIVENLWLTFVSDQPDPAEVARLTDIWRANDLELRPLLSAMFLSDAFWDPANRGTLVKSPVEVLVGAVRSLGITRPDAQELRWMTEDLGQSLFLPPNVGGWPQGVEWINDATAASRATYLTWLLYEPEPVQPASAMMTAPAGEGNVTAAFDDLRVGQVFTPYIEERDPGAGFGGSFVLFDVGFQGQTWRSITFWMEYNETDDFTSLYLDTRDCQPQCLASLPQSGDEPGWVGLEPWEGVLDTLPDLSATDLALMRALGAHLPELVATTENQSPFRSQEGGADIGPFLLAADTFAANSARAFGAAAGQFVSALSGPNTLGLAGYGQVQQTGDIDSYIEARNAAARLAITPPTPYETPADWLHAIPGTGFESARARTALLAVRPLQKGDRDELVVGDPAALVRDLILSPVYQVK